MSNAPLLANAQDVGPDTFVTLGCLKDCSENENRVSLTPNIAEGLKTSGYFTLVEYGAGTRSGFTDQMYVKAGCKLASRAEVMRVADVLFSINAPEAEFTSMKGKMLVSWVGRLLPTGKQIVSAAAKCGVSLIDVTAVPRITIAQALDVLSSQAKVAGQRAVTEASYNFTRFQSAEMTSAGKYPPAQTFVLGCGVAGLQAIGAARALGSVVRAWDVRDVSDQAASLGASWVKVDFKEDGAGQGGYAKESSADFTKAQHATFHKHLQEVDIVITTAAIPGRPSPKLITANMVADMKPGSVIIDLAALGGGNCEMTQKDTRIVTENGVVIIGHTDLPSRMAPQSSAMYAQNMANMIKHVEGKEKAKSFFATIADNLSKGDDGDIVTRSIICCRDGKELAFPPPPQPTPPKPKTEAKKVEKKPRDPFTAAVINAVVAAVIISILLGLGEAVPPSLFTTFLLAGAAGYQVVWGVAHALHTPLMAVTNAISGMTAVGGMILLNEAQSTIPRVCAMMGVGVSFVNIMGGFAVSQRMLNLFRRAGDKDYSAMLFLPGSVLLAVAQFGGSAYLRDANSIASLMCIAAIGGLATQSTANSGCKLGMIGVAAGMVTTLNTLSDANLQICMVILPIFGMIGLYVGMTVNPIKLPQTVAAFHSLVGLAAMTTSIGDFLEDPSTAFNMHNASAMFGTFIGGITLTGSIIAFLKLNGNKSSKALSLPGKNIINLTMLLSFIFLVYSVSTREDGQKFCGLLALPIGAELWMTMVLSMIMGVHLVDSVGGGDMPVCITVLNSYSGWALVAEGFLLDSPMLTVIGSLIGFSGAILTHIMCVAMNRDIFNVIFGGINAAPAAKKGEKEKKEHIETSVEAVAGYLVQSKKVLIVPGYGMAVSRAQTPVSSLASLLRSNNVECKFGIHPVAGRMPGQMNVLLAEAGCPYDWVFEMDDINPDMESFDVCIVMGANDITNSAAQEVDDCPIAGMPVIEVWRSKKVIFCKRSMAGGYADIENPVFFKPNTEMLLGDAKKTAEGLSAECKKLYDAV
jgi:NAD(P) transhydrogenase